NGISNQRRSLTGLVADLWRESADLIRAEAALAKAEISDKASRFGSGLVWLVLGGAVLFAGLVLVLVAGVAGLAHFLPEEHAAWLAPLIAGAVVLPLGLALLARGTKIVTSTPLKPAQTLRSVRKDVEVLKEHMP
ncbi:MAG TPA: phage holin family protein, partial [Burkholderiales bacterium]